MTIPDIVMKDKIMNLSEYLNLPGVIIKKGDFTSCLYDAEKGDVLYFDPPYDYDDNGFDAYVPYGFKIEQLKKLKEISDEMVDRGCKVIISNNDTINVRDIFKKYKIKSVMAKRFINCDGKKRSHVKEVIISSK